METPTETKPETTEPTNTDNKGLQLPRLNGPVMEFNQETKMFWIGFPVDMIIPFEASLLLDSMKIEYLKAFNLLVKEAQEKKNKIVTPADLRQGMKNFVSKFKK